MSELDPDFVEAEGDVHLANMPGNPEFTLCGDAYDLAALEDADPDGGYAWTPTKSRTVTCPKCVAIILACRGVRVSQGAPHE